jgi:hypothetical protein
MVTAPSEGAQDACADINKVAIASAKEWTKSILTQMPSKRAISAMNVSELDVKRSTAVSTKERQIVIIHIQVEGAWDCWHLACPKRNLDCLKRGKDDLAPRVT